MKSLLPIGLFLLFCSYSLIAQPLFEVQPTNNAPKGFDRLFTKQVEIFGVSNKELADWINKNLSYDQLVTVDDESYQGVNLFTMGPKSIYDNELLGLYVYVVPRKSRL